MFKTLITLLALGVEVVSLCELQNQSTKLAQTPSDMTLVQTKLQECLSEGAEHCGCSTDSEPSCPDLNYMIANCDIDNGEIPFMDLAASKLCYECIDDGDCNVSEDLDLDGFNTIAICFEKTT